MKVSFIIPVYKAEKYLANCVDSLSSQTYKNLEIILVDDGSPDGSPALCDQLATIDNRIRVIHKSNGGAASARNEGIRASKGDYIIFCDADDFWRTDTYLDDLIHKTNAHPECDFLNFNCSYYYDSKGRYRDFVAYSDDLLSPVDKNTAVISLVKSGTFPMSPCTKIINREFLLKNDIWFPEGTISEDIPWFIKMLDCSQKTVFCNDYQYAYRQEVETSVTHSCRGVNDLLCIVENGVKAIDLLSFNKSAKEALLSFYAYELCILLTSYPEADKEIKNRVRNLLWLLDYQQNPKVAQVNLLKNYTGLSLTIRALRLYNWCRRRNNG